MPFTYRGFVLPEPLRFDLDAYASDGVPLCGFLEAVIANDFRDACFRADDKNAGLLPVLACYVHNDLPHDCHGSRDAYRAWLRRKNDD